MLDKINPASSPRLKRRDDETQAKPQSSKLAPTPGDRAPLPGMPPSRRASSSEAPRRPAPQRSQTFQPRADWAGTKDNVYDGLGEKVPEKTFQRLAGLVATQSAFKESRTARNFAFAMQKTGLMTYKGAARLLRVPPHVAQVLWMAIADPDVRKIAKMGLEIARANPETNGIPPEGFKPLYDLMHKWGLDNKAALVDPEKFEKRRQFMKDREAEVGELRQFGEDIAKRLPGEADDAPGTHEADARAAEDNSLVGFLASFFVSANPSHPKAEAA